MKKLFYLILFLGLLFISSCNTPPTESYINNIQVNDFTISWDQEPNASLYYVKVTHSFEREDITFTTEKTSYDLSTYISDLEKDHNGFTLTVFVKSNNPNCVYKNSCDIVVEEKVIELSDAPVPTNLTIKETTLYWDQVKDIESYEIEISNGKTLENVICSTNNFNFTSYLIENTTYTFKVKSLKSDSYKADSNYSESISYVHEEIQVEKEIFNYDFTKIDNIMVGASITKFEKYADKSLKFSASNFYLITPAFTAYKSFSVKAVIKGNNCSGDAVITIYGLDSENKVLEKQEFAYTIENSKHELKAEFTNTNIVKIKFEYTKKDKGNVALYSLSCNHDEETDKVTNIELINNQDTFVINEEFNYNGNLLLTYKSGNKKEIPLASLKDNFTITNFNTTTKGTYTCSINYLDVIGTFTYNVIYSYEALYSYADVVNVYTIDLNNQANNLFTVLSVKKEQKEINILFDYNKQINNTTYNLLTNELANYLESDLLYFYSVNNQTIFNQNNLLPLTNSEYNFAPDVDLMVSNEYFEIILYGYSYYFAVTDLETDHKVDILHVNSEITKDNITSLDPEHLILQEGSINEFINNGILVYQTDDEIFQYAPTLNKTFFYTFTKNSFTIDGNTTELSNQTIWSDSETLGLHHKTIENYLYRKSYYGDIENLYGNELKEALKKVMTDTHTYTPKYGDAKTLFALTDSDPLRPGNIIMTYTSDSISSAWEQGVTWNREHIWPKSLSGGLYNSMSDSSKNAGSDLHHIRPALTAINSSRGNKMYGSVTNETYFYPGDNFTGDTARILFYLSIRYDMDMLELKVCDDLSLILNWHNQDNVDNLERNRNIQVQTIQGNYNPFIDNPWLADRIWK